MDQVRASEKQVRMEAFRELMASRELRAVIAVGNGCVGTNAYGCFRYLTDIHVKYHLSSAVFFRERPPVGILPDDASVREAAAGFLKELTVSRDPVETMISLLREEGVFKGKVGTFLDILPYSWYARLTEAFPAMELVDIAEDVFRIRNHHSPTEVEKLLRCGEIADAGYRAVLESVRPGMTEQQLVAEIEHATQRMGAEENFTLISSGRFSLEDNQLLPIRAATMFNRTLEKGDSVAMEITPRYQGYWTQLVRTVSVGEDNEDLKRMHAVCEAVIQGTLRELYPGNRIGNIANRVRFLTEQAGYQFALPCGHICGLDLNEERLSPDNDRLLEVGMTVILHPSIITPKIRNGIFWGQTYLITEQGFQCLMKSGQELNCIMHKEEENALS